MTHLKRFTKLPYLLDYLEIGKLVLLDPGRWDDKNDTEVILAYKKRKEKKNLFALCFSYGHETIHHWKTFANGSEGCYIKFDSEKLIAIFKSDDKLRHGEVEYKRVADVKPGTLSLDKMPFTKRKAYECENEYRVIWEGDEDRNGYELTVPLETVQLIKFSQQMPQEDYERIKEQLESNFKELKNKIDRSKIYENKIWISKFQ